MLIVKYETSDEFCRHNGCVIGYDRVGVEMVPVQVRITKKLVEEIDQLVLKGIYSNRSEVIRDATRRHVMNFSERK